MYGESHGGSELVVVTEYGATTQAVCTNPGSYPVGGRGHMGHFGM